MNTKQREPESSPISPTAWVRPNGGFKSGVAHMGNQCPPGWVRSAVPMYNKAALESAVDAAVETERARIRSLLRGEQACAADRLEGMAYRSAHDACGAVLAKL